ncbi:MAG: NAD(P)H-hydrate dehydratase, partial [Pseudobdellovibrionaceae bacterium]
KKLKADLWIDAVFGMGLNRSIQEPLQSVIRKFNESPGIKVSLDTPSGLDVNTGEIWGCAVRADSTLTVGQPKPGFFLNHGPNHTGSIYRINIDFPRSLVLKEARSVFLLAHPLVQRWLPVRTSTAHKGEGGATLIWAGSSSMPGAAVLAARAASRIGSGNVYVTQSEVLKNHPEAILWKNQDFKKIRAALLGPGFGLDPKMKSYFQVLRQVGLPSVIDADALTIAAKFKLGPFPENWVATPHAAELGRLLGCKASEVQSDRLKFARLAQQHWGGTIVLKGFHTVIATAQVSIIIPTGNVALAKGGSGDVLSGMIAGLMAQGVSSERAAMVGCYVHGWMADQWVRDKDYLSLTPSDLIAAIPQALFQLRAPDRSIYSRKD